MEKTTLEEDITFNSIIIKICVEQLISSTEMQFELELTIIDGDIINIIYSNYFKILPRPVCTSLYVQFYFKNCTLAEVVIRYVHTMSRFQIIEALVLHEDNIQSFHINICVEQLTVCEIVFD